MAANSTFANILLAPWQYYTRAAAFTFTAVVGANLFTSIFDKSRRGLLIKYPSTVTAVAVGKGLFFAPIWPAWYMTMAIRPKSAFYLGGGTVADQVISNVIGPSMIDSDKFRDAMVNPPTIKYDDKGLTVCFEFTPKNDQE